MQLRSPGRTEAHWRATDFLCLLCFPPRRYGSQGKRPQNGSTNTGKLKYFSVRRGNRSNGIGGPSRLKYGLYDMHNWRVRFRRKEQRLTRRPAAPAPNPRSQRYNSPVPDPAHNDDPSGKHRRHAVYATETAGLLLIAFLLLVLTLIRYWHDIHWSLH